MDKKWYPPYHKITRKGRLRQMFVSDLLPNLLAVLAHEGWYAKSRRSTLASCCLVCHEWNNIFTSSLYRNIVLNRDEPILTLSLLSRTLWHGRPAYRTLVENITIWPSTTAIAIACLVISSDLPNLRSLTMFDFELSQLPPRLAQHMRLLSKHCAVSLDNRSCLPQPQSVTRWFRSLQSTQPDFCQLTLAYYEARSAGQEMFSYSLYSCRA